MFEVTPKSLIFTYQSPSKSLWHCSLSGRVVARTLTLAATGMRIITVTIAPAFLFF
jgi:hypothetical protein